MMLASAKARCGFTLIEVLVVVTLLAMTATAGLVSLEVAGKAARMERTAAITNELDLRARLEGRRGTASLLCVDQDGSALVLIGRGSGERLERAELPPGVTLVLADPASGVALSGVAFDRRGVSEDYRVEVRANDRQRMWNVSGTTGWREALP